MRKSIIIVVGILILFALATVCYADYSVRIAQLERELLIIKDQLAQYRQESANTIRLNEGVIAEKIGAIKELRRLEQQEKIQAEMERKEKERIKREEEEKRDADRKAESHAGPDSGGDTVERNDESRGNSSGDRASEGNTPESESPESRPAEEGQEG